MKTLLTMADMAARRGTDKEIGLVQQIINYSPEITTIMGRTVPGTFATAKVQIGIPKGGAFRPVNQGVLTSSGTYEKRRFNAFFFDAQLQVDEAELVAAEQEGDSLGDLQADEVAGALMNKAILFSQQFYAGTNVDPNGFPGLFTLLQAFNGGDGKGGVIDSRTGKTIINTVNANVGSTNPACETIWYVWCHPQGVHFLFGGNKTIDVNPWVWQYMPEASVNPLVFANTAPLIQASIAGVANTGPAAGFIDCPLPPGLRGPIQLLVAATANAGNNTAGLLTADWLLE